MVPVFLTRGVFQYDIARRRSVAALCTMQKISSHPNDALPVPYVPVRVTRGALDAHRHTYGPSRCRTSQYGGLLFPSQCLSGTILTALHSMVFDWRVSKAGQMLFL